MLAGAVLYALILYALSFETPVVDAYAHVVRPSPTAYPDSYYTGRINLNTAAFDELLSLPGIGKVTAQAILDMRDMLGGFQQVEDILLVRGIGEKKFAALYDLIYAK